ncbi:hypothetical protein BDN72DRAFT_900047 [Pluteus cervinus]|uniref:Uncharacterized protein n=1 Tax=Pluteus cervinus TaxID=181527 RepID=A0ACD3AKH0_9AGAR|nr:hypothetical protein BDN72DRAFT_900047 [Pluteus cervinus]
MTTRVPAVKDDDDSDSELWGNFRDDIDWEGDLDSEYDAVKQGDSSAARESETVQENHSHAAAASAQPMVVKRESAPLSENRPFNVTASAGDPKRSASRFPHARFTPSSPSKETVVVSDGDGDDTDNEPISEPVTRNSSLLDVPSTSTSMTSIDSARVVAPSSSRVWTDRPPNTQPKLRQIPTNRIARCSAVASQVRVFKLSQQKPLDTPSVQIPSLPSGHQAAQPSRDIATRPPPALGPSKRFLDDQIGVDLKVEIIAHDSQVQRALDQNQIPWGAQWELARGVTLGAWGWADVMTEIQSFRGPNNVETAYKVVSTMMKRVLPPNIRPHTIWKELDREQAAIIENRERGLGLMGTWYDEPDWYGGRIQQLARVVKNGKTYKIQLQCMEKRRSHRFARYLGSRRIIQLRVPDDLVNQENKAIRSWLQRKFVLCGRVYVPFHSKEGSAYLMETNENYDRFSANWAGDQYRRSFAHFINWHNPLHLNEQAISKWSTRFGLGLSNSIPTIELALQNMEFIDDKYADGFDPSADRKAQAEEILTDGCGFMNEAMAKAVQRVMAYTSRPTALQGRIAGAKGLWTLHPTDNDPEPKIWIRKSQNKINLPTEQSSKSHRIFELVATSHYSSSAPLKGQSIVNLSFNGVPQDLLINLLEIGLRQQVQPLMEWDKRNASSMNLWQTINLLGGVVTSRSQRLASSLGRALGLAGRLWDRDKTELADARDTDPIEEMPSSPNRQPYSGAPIGPHETCVELIQAGFHPADSIPLRKKIRDVMKLAIQSAIDDCCIPLSTSVRAFVIPDPVGVLLPGEIFFRSSQGIKDEITQTFFNVLVGEVLIGRYPILLPSDVQRVVAVDDVRLHKWSDVIIVPSTGKYSFANILSGGDYDGDEPFIIWEPSLVEQFDNKNLFREPDDLKGFFESQVEKVSQFRERVQCLPKKEAQEAFQEVLLLGLSDAKVGMYSKFHQFATNKYGYAHPETILFAYLSTTLLDSSKSGLRLKEGVFEEHNQRFSRDWPSEDDVQRASSGQQQDENILDAIKSAGLRIQNEVLALFDQQLPPSKSGHDPHLPAPYFAAKEAAEIALARYDVPQLERELVLIQAHVQGAYKKWSNACSESRRRKDTFFGDDSKKKKSASSKRSEDLFVEAARLFAEPVPGVLITQNVNEIKASYSHSVSASFGLSVAFQDLCVIKARASSTGIAATIRTFDEAKALASSSLRALSKVGLEGI